MNSKKVLLEKMFVSAVKKHQKNDLFNAKKLYLQVLEINSAHVEANFLLGLLSSQTNDLNDAFSYYLKVIEIKPNHTSTINNLSNLLGDPLKLKYITQVSRSLVKKILLILFKRNDIDHNDIFLVSRLLLFKENNITSDYIKKELHDPSPLLLSHKVEKLCKDQLFQLMLQKSLIADHLLEKILTKIRRDIVLILYKTNREILIENLEFVISLAEQCFLNEYIYSQNKGEIDHVNFLKKKIENSKKVNKLDVAIFGCFFPINGLKKSVLKLIKDKETNSLFNDLIIMQVNEPKIEAKLLKSMKSLGKIKDFVSKKVRDQYENNPYPRWRYTYLNPPVSSIVIINSLIKPNKIEINKKFDNPKILIAGCGTGKQVLLAKGYKNSKILAIDLSRSSLAYAKRKIQELNLKNISFLQADILDLKKLKSKFDIIECAGVLHHMENPHKGLKELLGLLEPHGILRLGLYSELARKDIVKVRSFIKKKKYKNNITDIRTCREEIEKNINDELLKKLFFRRDFYSTSSARDLMFHTQEYRFTINELYKIITMENLEFLGFNNNLAKNKFASIYPNDKKQTSLNNWSEFEINNNETFIGMYDFLIRKNSTK